MTSNGKRKVDCLKNPDDATSYTTGSRTKVKFECDVCQHTFSSIINGVSNGRAWCGQCSSKWKHCGKDNCVYCYKRSFASYAGVTPNGKRKVDCLLDKNDKYEPIGSHTKVKFDCDVCQHTFSSSNDKVSIGRWCGQCSFKWKHCGKDVCNYCYKRSFGSYLGVTPNGKRKVDCLVDKNDKYEPIGSHTKVKFDCDVCQHAFSSQIYNISADSWCGMCSKTWKHCGKDDCNYCYKRSFGSYAGVTPNGKRKVECLIDVNDAKKPISHNGNVKFECDVCQHAFSTTPNGVSNGRWCGQCSIKWKHCGKDNCVYCYKRSFGSYAGVTPNGKRKVDCLLDKNDKKKPKSQNTKVKFDCDVCQHAFSSAPNQVSRGRWCPKCKNKTELKVLNFLAKELGMKTKHQYTIPDIKEIYKIQHRFDLLLVKYNLVFEIDGYQHNARAWHDKNDHALFRRQIKDKWKEFIARKRGLRVVRFDQESIWADSYDWRAEMKDVIKDALSRCHSSFEMPAQTRA
jgi:very-short-patch-repair endonuclease